MIGFGVGCVQRRGTELFFLDLRCFELPEGFKEQLHPGAFFKLLRPAMPRRTRFDCGLQVVCFAFLPAVLNHMNKTAGPPAQSKKPARRKSAERAQQATGLFGVILLFDAHFLPQSRAHYLRASADRHKLAHQASSAQTLRKLCVLCASALNATAPAQPTLLGAKPNYKNFGAFCATLAPSASGLAEACAKPKSAQCAFKSDSPKAAAHSAPSFTWQW